MTQKITHKLYNNSVEIDFYPVSHRYRLLSVDGEKRGDWIPSPSSVLSNLDKSQALVPWAVNQYTIRMNELMGDAKQFERQDLENMLAEAQNAHREKKESSATVGSCVHEYAEQVAKFGQIERSVSTWSKFITGYDSLTEEEKQKVENGIDAFNVWFENTRPRFIESEFLVYSKKHNFVGTADGFAEINGKKYIIDFKTSKYIYNSHLYQISAYLKAKEEETGEKITGAIILKINKDDVYTKTGELLAKAGECEPTYMSRADLVTAFQGFKNLRKLYEIEKKITKKLKQAK